MKESIIDTKKYIESQLDNLISEYIDVSKSRIGRRCHSCGHIQGQPANGFQYYFCKHESRNMNRIFQKKRKAIIRLILEYIKTEVM